MATRQDILFAGQVIKVADVDRVYYNRKRPPEIGHAITRALVPSIIEAFVPSIIGAIAPSIRDIFSHKGLGLGPEMFKTILISKKIDATTPSHPLTIIPSITLTLCGKMPL